MNFREQLNKVNELKLSILDIEVANEADCLFEFKYTDSEFEQLCHLLKEAYLKTDYIELNHIAYYINELISADEKTIKDVLSMDKYTILDGASYYN